MRLWWDRIGTVALGFGLAALGALVFTATGGADAIVAVLVLALATFVAALVYGGLARARWVALATAVLACLALLAAFPPAPVCSASCGPGDSVDNAALLGAVAAPLALGTVLGLGCQALVAFLPRKRPGRGVAKQ